VLRAAVRSERSAGGVTAAGDVMPLPSDAAQRREVYLLRMRAARAEHACLCAGRRVLRFRRLTSITEPHTRRFRLPLPDTTPPPAFHDAYRRHAMPYFASLRHAFYRLPIPADAEADTFFAIAARVFSIADTAAASAPDGLRRRASSVAAFAYATLFR